MKIEAGLRCRHYKGNEYAVSMVARCAIDDKPIIVYAEAAISYPDDETQRYVNYELIVRNPEFQGDANCYPEVEFFRVTWDGGEWWASRAIFPSDKQDWEANLIKPWGRSIDNFCQILGNTNDPITGTMFHRFQVIEGVRSV